MKKNSMRRAAAVAAAMMIAFCGTGVLPVGNEISAVLTASAASESVNVTLTDLCMKTPTSGEVIRNSAVIKTFTEEEITSGITFNADSGTVIVLHYGDGDMTFNALSKKLTNNTRKSGISRELFRIPSNMTGVYHNNTNGYGVSSFRFISTGRDPVTGDKGTYIAPINADVTNPQVPVAYSERAWLVSPDSPPGDMKDLYFDYEQGTEIFVAVSPGSGTSMYRYDVDSEEFVEAIGNNKAPTTIGLTADMFPKAAGFKKVTVTGNNVKNQNTDYGETITTDNGEATVFTAEEIATGEVKISYSFSIIPTATAQTFDTQAHVLFDMGDGNTVEYLLFGKYAVLNNDTRPAQTAKDENGNEYTEPGTGDTLPEALEEGKPVISNEILGTPNQDYEYTVSIYQGSKLYAELTKAQYETGFYPITAYDSDMHYYVKVGAENGEDGIWYKWDKQIGTWHKRINTAEDPIYTVQINPYTIPEDMYYVNGAGSAAPATGSILYNGKEKAKFDADTFGKGYEYAITTKDSMNWDVSFNYLLSVGGDTIGMGTATNDYIFMGIDPEPVDNAHIDLTETTDFPVKTNAGDVIHVTGETYTGNAVDFTFTVPLGEGGDTIKLPKGEYVFENQNTKLKDSASSGEGDTEPKEVNLVDPIETSTFKVTDMNGETLDEGELADGVLDNVSDLNKTAEELGNAPYYGYETKVGTENSTDPEKYTEEKGYFIIKEDGSIEKIVPKSDLRGDVDLDGDVDVADIVMLQKYLLNTETFTIENFINANVYTDGSVDVFDLATLKRIVLNSTSAKE